MRWFASFALALAIGVMGCSESTGAGDGGVGGGGNGGMSGSAGIGGGGVGGGPINDYCIATADDCMSSPIEPHRQCCEHGVPDQAKACDGTESLVNPASCSPTENRVNYRLTLLEVEGDCNVGYDIDHCHGETCTVGGFVTGEGADGVDNGFAALAPVLVSIGSDYAHLNQAFSDALCGRTDSYDEGTCEGGGNHGQPCVGPDDCLWPDGSCDYFDDDCLGETEPLNMDFLVDSNPAETCANVSVLAGGETHAHILNLSEEGCLSGTLGTIRWLGGDYGYLTNTLVRTTLSPTGFSDGLLGAVLDNEAAIRMIEAVTPSFPDAWGFWQDTNTPAVSPATIPRAQCDGMSATFRIGGVVVDPQEGGP